VPARYLYFTNQRDTLLGEGVRPSLSRREEMKREILIAAMATMILFAGAMTASAQVRLDIDINDPIYFGYTDTGTQTGIWNPYPYIPIPDAKLMYQFSLGPINLGAGVRVFSLIIENFAYPEIYGELVLNPFTVNLSVGGLEFLMFGLLSDALTPAGVTGLNGYVPLIIPDLSVSYKLNDIVRISGGVFIMSPLTSTSTIGGVLDNNVFAGYLKATFVVVFK
jgi:hypothetical protein